MDSALRGEEPDRGERTLDVVFWLVPVGSAAVVVLPLLAGLASLLHVDAGILLGVLVVGLPASVAVWSGVRHAVRRTDDEFGLTPGEPPRAG